MLENLLNTKPKKKLLSVFFAFPKRSFTVQELHETAAASVRVVNETVRELVRSGAVNVAQKNRHRLFRVNPRFPLYQEITDLLQDEMGSRDDSVSRLLRKLPNAKLMILSGIFTLQPNLPVDLLIVGDNIGRLRLATILSQIEKLTGMEVAYAVMPESEYEYRRLMNDRFVRDILDYPHLVVINNLQTKKR